MITHFLGLLLVIDCTAGTRSAMLAWSSRAWDIQREEFYEFDYASYSQ